MAVVLHWFRQDLRLQDNPALAAASQAGAIVPLYILDTENCGDFAMGAASQVWLHHSLQSLNKQLDNKLVLRVGDPLSILSELVRQLQITAVFWNRCYEPWQIGRDKAIKAQLEQQGVSVYSFNGALLWEPWQILKRDGTPYKVFTPFYQKGCLAAAAPDFPTGRVKLTLKSITDKNSLESLNLLPVHNWHQQVVLPWQPGTRGAEQKLAAFLQQGVDHYKEGRNFPALNHVSNLSPHIHFGEISVHRIWDRVSQQTQTNNTKHFLSELGWREFSYYLLYHFPGLPTENFQAKFNHFPWRQDDAALACWQQGQTGYPFVDAGMRQLYATGTMHNRVRMVVGSFLVKNLLLDWRLGERWFWDCLFDADLANNCASWQWVAGCGADAAPYFRIFNPILQGQKFDPDGIYTKQFVPELKALPTKYLFCPWKAPAEVLQQAGVTLGETYPHPIVDASVSRQRALDALAQCKEAVD